MIFDRAPSTVYKYYNSYKRWYTWASIYGLCPLPADGANVALYLGELVNKSKSPAPVLSAMYGISWAHRKALARDPCEHPLVIQVREATKRLLSRPVVKKKNLSIDHVHSVVDKFGYHGTSLSNLQIVIIVVVGFAGFLRWSDLSNIRVENIKFCNSHMDIVLEKRKNDQYRTGHSITIARTGSPYCPVSLTERFLARANISMGPLLREIRVHGFKQEVSPHKLRYSSARSQILRVFTAIGLDKKRFGLHSLRAGGASAASEAGVSDRLIALHGGWKSESSRDGYIRDSKQTLLSVSRALDL